MARRRYRRRNASLPPRDSKGRFRKKRRGAKKIVAQTLRAGKRKIRVLLI